MKTPLVFGLCGYLLSCSFSTAFAQPSRDDRPAAPRTAPAQKPSKKPPAEAKPERPAAAPLRVETLSPELEEILKDWEVKSAEIKKLIGSFSRWTYDDVWGIERRAEGKFYYEAPDKGVYTIKGSEIPEKTVSRRKDKDGNPYRSVVKDNDERWVCNGKEVYQIHDAEKTYEVNTIPPENQGENIIEGPLPFLFGMKVDHAKRRYSLTLMKDTKDEVWIKVKPRIQQDAANYLEAVVILDRVRFLPKAVRMLDPSGNKETVHMFKLEEMKQNPRNFLWSTDPLKPKLSNYKKIVTSEAAGADAPARRATDKSNGPAPLSRSANANTSDNKPRTKSTAVKSQ